MELCASRVARIAASIVQEYVRDPNCRLPGRRAWPLRRNVAEHDFAAQSRAVPKKV